jgi:hypothetical protein
MKFLPRWAIFLVAGYAGLGLLTLVFQTYIRLDQCSSSRACAINIAKGVVWSTIWPAYWPVYAAGLHPGQEAMARLKNDIQADQIGIVHRRFPCRSPNLHFFGYRFRIIIKDAFAEGEVCWDFSSRKWSWRILPEYPLSRQFPLTTR